MTGRFNCTNCGHQKRYHFNKKGRCGHTKVVPKMGRQRCSCARYVFEKVLPWQKQEEKRDHKYNLKAQSKDHFMAIIRKIPGAKFFYSRKEVSGATIEEVLKCVIL